MVTENSRRWPVGLHGTPARFGKLLEYVNFDATFFAVHGKQASVRALALLGIAQWRCVAVLCTCKVVAEALPEPRSFQHDGLLEQFSSRALLGVV